GLFGIILFAVPLVPCPTSGDLSRHQRPAPSRGLLIVPALVTSDPLCSRDEHRARLMTYDLLIGSAYGRRNDLDTKPEKMAGQGIANPSLQSTSTLPLSFQ